VLPSSSGVPDDFFGYAVSVSGHTAVVGAPQVANERGAAWVYRVEGGDWVEEQELVAPNLGQEDYFGASVAVSDDVIVVGVPGEEGFAWVFRYDGSEWLAEQKLEPSDGATYDSFGDSVAIDGDVIVVGASRDDDAGYSSGSAYVFEYRRRWIGTEKLTASDGAADDEFGTAVAVSGDLIVVGAPFDDGVGVASGSAYVFVIDDQGWSQDQKLTASDSATFDRFGFSVAISGDVALVGASRDSHIAGEAGSAYVFWFDGADWIEEQKLIASDAADGDGFGTSVSLDGDVAVVGSPFDDDYGSYSGSAYIYGFDGTDWIEEHKINAPDASAEDWFGHEVSLSGDVIVIGAFVRDPGAAYAFDF